VLLPELLPLLDGTRSVPEIVGKLGRAAEPSVTNALAALAENGLLTEGTPLPRSSAPRRAASAMFVAAATRRTTLTKADSALASARVTIAGESPIAGEAARLLSASGVRDVRCVQLEDVGAADEFVVCAPAPGETAGLTMVNASRLAAGRAWLAVMPHDGRSLVVGPLYLPGQSACHACYRLRRASASGYEEDFELVDVEPIRAACPEALAAVAAGLAATITLRWLSTSDPSLPGRCYALEAGVVLGLSLHHVLRVPRCPACGPGDMSMPSPWFKETARDD
jgi:bacteriocin biosynthesis cyclodehydratase domain-containing protein